MQYGVMNNPVLNLEQEIACVAQSAFDYIEIALDPPGAHYSDVIARGEVYGGFLQQHRLPVICHMPTFVALADLSPHIREASLLETVGGFEAAAFLGAQKIVLHPPFFSGMGRYARAQSIELAWESLDFLTAKAYEYGFTVCLENLDGRDDELGSDAEDMARLLERYEDIYMTLDMAHAFVRGGHKAMERFWELCHGRIKHVHISDNWGRADDHLPLGVAGLNLALAAGLLKKYAYDDTITLEVFATDRAYRDLSLTRFKAVMDAAD